MSKQNIAEIVRGTFSLIGYISFLAAIIFFFVFSFIVTGTKGEDYSRDLLGFPIPHPPLWTSYIPYLGSFLGFVFELFSIHGEVQLGIMVLLISIGSIFIKLGEAKKI